MALARRSFRRWDDFKVTHTNTPVMQSNDYYPFGLTFNNYQRQNNPANLYKYNGKEEQDELALNWTNYCGRRGSARRGGNQINVDISNYYFSEIMNRNDIVGSGAVQLNPLGSSMQSGARYARHEFGHAGGLPNRG